MTSQTLMRIIIILYRSSGNSTAENHVNDTQTSVSRPIQDASPLNNSNVRINPLPQQPGLTPESLAERQDENAKNHPKGWFFASGAEAPVVRDSPASRAAS